MNRAFNYILRLFNIALPLITIIIFIRVSIVDVFNVPSESMRDELKPNDLILVNKTLYAGLLAQLFNKLNTDGLPARNEIYVFKVDTTVDKYYVKRCIGLPGDSIRINRGIVFLNGNAIVELSTVRHNYNIWNKNFMSLQTELDKMGVDVYNNRRFKRAHGYISISLNQLQKVDASKSKIVDSIKLDFDNDGLEKDNYNQNIFNVSSIRIPYRGMSILLNDKSFNLYQLTISKYEHAEIKKDGSTFFINGRKVTSYEFRNDYYFFMGDNREDSFDSRYFGVIPKQNLTGKLIYKFNH